MAVFNPKEFLDDYNIFSTDIGEDTQKGWLNIKCPFCNDPKHHGGFNLAGQYYTCWKCKGHKITDVIRALIGVDEARARSLFGKYCTLSGDAAAYSASRKSRRRDRPKSLMWPDGTGPLQRSGKNYLERRNFDPYIIERDWKIRQTDHLSDYRFRIIIPIFFDGEFISYQGRDITDKQDLRYKACRQEEEVTDHKNVLYGIDYIKTRKAIIVEGVTDTWRLGKGNAVGTFGTGFTKSQVLLLSEKIDEFIIWFDPEEEAQKIADELYFELTVGHNKKGEVVTTDRDPGDLTDREAAEFLKELRF